LDEPGAVRAFASTPHSTSGGFLPVEQGGDGAVCGMGLKRIFRRGKVSGGASNRRIRKGGVNGGPQKAGGRNVKLLAQR